MEDGSCPATQAAHSPRILNSNGSRNSNSNSNSRTHLPHLPTDLRLRILSLLPPHDLALAGRFTCRQAARRFGSSPQEHTARLSQPLPDHAAAATWCVEGARAAMRQLSLRHKLLLLSTAAASGCEANVEFAWQLLQPYVFPELLQTDHYHELLMRKITDKMKASVPNVGPAAVASGLAHLLPSLEQRCPGLLDPGRTLEAAARHCDLAGLQAAWEVVGQRLLSSLQPDVQQPGSAQHGGVQGLWRRVMAAAAGSAGPGATAKMEWALEKSRSSSSSSHVPAPDSEVWGAAAASGELPRVRWLHEHGLGLSAQAALEAALLHAPLVTIQRMEEQGGYLPAAGDPAWAGGFGVCTSQAAAAARDSAAKLRWLAGRRGPATFHELGYTVTAMEAAQHGNLEALQELVQQYGQQQNGADLAAAVAAFPQRIATYAALSSSVPTLAWLRQAGCALEDICFLHAFTRGDLPMVRWLLEAGCPRGDNCISDAVSLWPFCATLAESRRLVEAVGLLAAARWPLNEKSDHHLLIATSDSQPWVVLHALLELQPAGAQDLPYVALAYASSTGCEATLEELLGMGVRQDQLAGMRVYWYLFAMRNGDRGTLEWLRRLGVPLNSPLVLHLALTDKPPVPAPALAWVKGQQEPQCGAPVG